MNCTRNAGIYTAVLAIIMMVSAVMIPVADVSANTEPEDTYDIIYIVNSTAFNPNDDVVEKGEVTLLTKLPEGATAPIGQEFKGWMYNSNIVESINVTEEEKTYTVTAVFSVAEYKVTFIANGESNTAGYKYNETVVVPEDEDPATPTAPTGYTFVGWSDGTATLTEIPVVTDNVTYVAVYEITDVPVETFTVTFKVGGETYNTQTVANIDDVIFPYIDGYSWGEAVIDAEGNAVISAIADPVQPENSFGITNTELAIIIGAFLAVILALFIIAYKLGFIEIGKKGAVKE